MWFKNIQLFQFNNAIAYQPDRLEKDCEQAQFTPCSALKPLSAGFVSPITQDESGPLVFASQGFMLLCIKIQEKLLPPSVLREQLKLKIKEMEGQLGQRVSKGERQRIKEELEYTLLGKAFDRSSLVYLYINTHTQHLIIDTNGSKKLQLVHKVLQPILAEHGPEPIETQSISHILTQWVRNKNYPGTFSLLNRCTMQDSRSPKAKISLTHINLLDEFYEPLLDDSNQITQLKINWDEKINFTLKQDFSISQVNFLDNIKDLAKDGMNETDEDRFAADFFVMSETISKFLADLLPLFEATEEIEETQGEAVAA